MAQKRDFYRIPYPVAERPRLVVGTVELEVLDISERGARVALASETAFSGDSHFAATVRFKDGTTVQTTGVVHRREGKELILGFSEGLPYSVIASEQQRLFRLFGREALQPKN